MRASDKRRITQLVRKWQPLLGLEEWQIEVGEQAPDQGLAGETLWVADIRLAEMRLAPDIIGTAREEVTVLHELLHLTPNFSTLGLAFERNELLAVLKPTFEALLDDVSRWLWRQERGSVVGAA